jgi:hypothetical protein
MEGAAIGAVSAPRPESPGLDPQSSNRRMADVIAIVVFVSAIVIPFWYIHRFAVNMIFYDQWKDIEVIRSAGTGTLNLSTLWAQHNENRILFPNLIVLLLAYTTHFNVVVEDYLNGLLAIATTGLIIGAHRRRSPSAPWIAYCPVVLVLLSLFSLGDTLFGFNLSWYLVLFGLATALYLLDRPVPTRLTLVLGVAAAALGSFSSLQGLLIWPAGLAILFLRRRSVGVIAAWIASAVITTAIYFAHFNFALAGDDNSSVWAHPLESIKFFLSTIGNVLGYFIPTTPGAGSTGDLVLGLVVFAIALWALVLGFRRDESGGSPVGVALIIFGLLFAASITLGRSQLGLSSASRYLIFTLTIWVGAYLVLLSRLLQRRPEGKPTTGDGRDHDPAPTKQWVRVITLAALALLVGLIGLQVLSGFGAGLNNAAGWHSEELDIADVTVNIDKAPDGLVQSQLGSYDPDFFRQMAAYARTDRLSLFGTSAVAKYTRQGLYPDLVTAVTRPVYGATLSGTTVFDASVIYPAHLTTVRFSITGGSLYNPVVVPGRLTAYGWIGVWDTTSVANEDYEIRSVVVHAGAPPIFSAPVTVVVSNS